MWLFTSFGFYSAVKDLSNDSIKLRSRSRRDLENIQRRLGELSSREILCYHDADYRYRMILSVAEFKRLMGYLSEQLDYENFKDHIATLPDQREKVRWYGKVWEVMWRYQCEGVRE